MRSAGLALLTLVLTTSPVPAADADDLKKLLEYPVLTPRQTVAELQEFLDARIPQLPEAKSAAEWTKETARLQKEVLERVVFRGEAANWRDAKPRIEYADTIPGEGYTVKKLRYEIISGFWVPALLYLPDKLAGKAPVMLAVNGHDRVGKAVNYKQARCINLAKRGVIVLNVEWLGMGQLNVPGNHHGAMNQLDLCGTSGLSLFYLNMTRGLDLLLAHPNADPTRVAVSGLSGGGWQTIFVSGLDPRVTLSNPVAGYSSFRTRTRYFKDLGDSEQTPTDLGTVVDYTHLTAMRAPRPTLLTYNAKDNCCFEAGYALPPLQRAADPFFKLFDAGKNLRTHVNHDPGDHNFGLDNREALYRMIGDHFFPADKSYSAKEIPCDKEMGTPDALAVELPKDNLTLNAVALKLAADLPRGAALPKGDFDTWQKARRTALKKVVRVPEYHPAAGVVDKLDERGEYKAEYRTVKAGPWSVPVVQVTRGDAKRTAVVVCDAGRAAAVPAVADLTRAGYRVLVADLYSLGEARPQSHDWLWGLMLATVGERPLGVQAAQLDALTRWAAAKTPEPLKVVAVGPRASTAALVSAALNPGAIGALDLHDPLGSFKEMIEGNRPVQTAPEFYCFGLLEQFDVADVAALVAPRPVLVKKPSDRAKKEFAGLAGWYKTLGQDFDPLR
ncbi:MAG: hypothetical protein JWO38_442 [Gemmataceae bacterium]|nr:hypothetical protein [Gemmataceae bacterium]